MGLKLEAISSALQVSGYSGLLIGIPIILYEIIAFVLPGLTMAERKFLGPIVLGSSVLFYAGIAFSYLVLTPAALTFFVSYSEGAVESLWSIDQYFEFVLVLMFSTGLSFQVWPHSLFCQLQFSCTFVGNSMENLSVVGMISGPCYTTAFRTARVGFFTANAVNLEICGGRLCGGCCCAHALDRPSNSNAPRGPTYGSLSWRCDDG